MAPIFRRNYLVCFYCNKKSGIKYDGVITQWECAVCDSVNYLDENGDITDPPVATDHVASNDLKYSLARPDSPLSDISSQRSDSKGFCSTCLKNQHLYITSLAQFHVEIDPSHPQYKEYDDKERAYRKKLEKRYPQVCEDCHAAARDGMSGALKLAKDDFVRKALNKSRREGPALRSNGITLEGGVICMGKLLWFIGLLGQLLWNFTVVVAIIQHYYAIGPNASLPPHLSALLSTLSEASSSLPSGRTAGLWGLMCSVISFWWNPKFKNLNRGFASHIKGFGDWYNHQFISLVIRGLFYFVMRNESHADSNPSATGAAHGFIAVFITFLSFRSRRLLKVDMKILWNSTPEKLPYIGPGGSPKQGGNSLEDVLTEIGLSPSRKNRPISTPSPPSYTRYRPEPYQPGSIRVGRDQSAPIQPLKALSISPNGGRTNPSLFDNICNQPPASQPTLGEQYAGSNLGAMDWSPEPSPPKSQHRAFTENLPVNNNEVFFGRARPQKNTKLFGQSPVVAQSGPFWFKVPPAPITPAHQLRNPPNQPRMRVASQEQRENLFNNVSRRSSPIQEPSETAASTNFGSQRQGIEFAQQKFFAPTVPSEEHNDLIEAMSVWKLSDSDSPIQAAEKKSKVRHLWQGVALFLGLIFWNHAMNNPSEHTKNITLAIITGCLCIGARTILDNTIYTMEEKQNVVADTLGSCLGGLECAAAGYGLLEIVAGRGNCDSCGSLGTILIGGMMVHDLWLALFG